MSTDALKLYNKLAPYPGGRWLFSQLVSWRAPYFASIGGVFESLRAGFVEVHLKKRRKVHNHIGTVHALAIGNLCELAAGTLIEASLPKHLRWIPKGMQISYLKKAATDLRAICQIEHPELLQAGDLPMKVDVFDRHNVIVVSAVITMWLSDRPTKIDKSEQ
jgi:acyl-coenzyme A thioesterase PaaI-like protein